MNQSVNNRPQKPVTFCCFMSCTNECTTGPRHLLLSVVLCLAPTSPPQAPDTCYSLLFYVLPQPVHHRPQTPVTFFCFMSCTNQSSTGPRHLLPSVVLCLASKTLHHKKGKGEPTKCQVSVESKVYTYYRVQELCEHSEFRSCVKVEVAVLGFPS